MKPFIIALGITISLSGCAHMNSEFECPMKPGVRCESIDSVNERVDRGEIGSQGINVSGSSSQQTAEISWLEGHTTMKRPIDDNISSRHKGEPLRYGETVLRVWISPFEDTQGNYHQESTIFSVIRPGAWVGVPVKEIKEEA